ncbi:serglycin [Colossoma macropomum]|uniref:serglycin n=1 Tax=Colossoma macropomum TaxID=42526 RepID=UPI0018643678|nr:serglycin [Colossoma macropomum]
MRFCYRIALALLLVYLFEDSVLGAPTTGRFNWLNCKPDGKDANCVHKQGPLLKQPKDIVPVDSSEDTPETETEEQSGESSGDLDPFDTVVRKDWMDDSPVQAMAQDEASGEIDYSNYVSPEQVEPKLSEEDLRKDNMIQ